MKTKLISILLALLPLVGHAQYSTISGTIRNTANEAVPGAVIRMWLVTDSTLIAGEMADAEGKFIFSGVRAGRYFLRVSALGQKPCESGVLKIDSVTTNVNLPVMVMLPAQDVQLKEVLITSKKPLIVQEIDKTVVNVESMISSATRNTLEVLERTPGVSVSSNGDVSLNGRAGVLVLIDGRSTYMSGQDLAAYLKSLPGGILDKIELIDNPSSKYDASGNAIINIRLKKNRTGGFLGSVSLGGSQGRYTRMNDAVNLNYNHKKVNLFTSLGYSKDKNYVADVYDRRFFDESNLLVSRLQLKNDQISEGRSFNGNVGVDYVVTAKTTVGAILNINAGNRNSDLAYKSDQFDPSRKPTGRADGSSSVTDKRLNMGANLNLLHKFNNQGRELSADVNFLRYKSRGKQSLYNDLYNASNELVNQSDFQYRVPNDVKIYTLKADYVHPFKSKAKIEGGFKSSIVDNENLTEVYNISETGAVIDNSQTNHFIYHENINAAYINGQKMWKRFGVQAGLRVENTIVNGHQLGNETVTTSSFTKNYTGAFPSFYVSYKLDSIGKNTLGLMAVRRISRPNYQQMNPFVFMRDRFSYTAGNPMLDPQYQSRIEVKYQHKQLLNMGLSYNYLSDLIFQTTEAVEDVLYTKPKNIAHGYMVLLNTTLSLSPTKWWYLNPTLRVSHMGISGQVYTEILNFDVSVVRLEMNNYFTFGKKWTGEFGGYYASADLNGQTATSGMYRINGGIQRKILGGKGSIRLAFDDLLHSWKYHNRSLSLKQSEYFQTSISDTQRISFAVTYRFGKETFARKRRHHNNASDDEKGRVE